MTLKDHDLWKSTSEVFRRTSLSFGLSDVFSGQTGAMRLGKNTTEVEHPSFHVIFGDTLTRLTCSLKLSSRVGIPALCSHTCHVSSGEGRNAVCEHFHVWA